MSVLTKAQVRTAIMQAIDDPQNKRWTAANLDVLIGLVEDTMFQTINDTFEYFLSNTETLAATGGAVALSAFAKRFYRVQKVISSGVELQPRLYPDAVPQATYYLLGSNLVTDPTVGSGNLTITYSYLPTKFGDLATDGTVLTDYPEGHESALIYLASSFAMIKGDAESMQQIARMADLSVEAMLTHVARRYPIGANMQVQRIKSALMRNPVLSGVAPQGQ